MKKAFTLIELIVVMAIIAILALILVPQVTGYISNSQESVCLSNARTLLNETRINITLDTDGTYRSKLISLASNGAASPDNTATLFDSYADDDGLNTCPGSSHYLVYTESVDVITIMANDPDRILLTESDSYLMAVSSEAYLRHTDMSLILNEFRANYSEYEDFLTYNFKKIKNNDKLKNIFNDINPSNYRIGRARIAETGDERLIFSYQNIKNDGREFYYSIEQEDGSIKTYKGNKKIFKLKEDETAEEFEKRLMENFGYIITNDSPIED